jgi:hypothetical protein
MLEDVLTAMSQAELTAVVRYQEKPRESFLWQFEALVGGCGWGSPAYASVEEGSGRFAELCWKRRKVVQMSIIVARLTMLIHLHLKQTLPRRRPQLQTLWRHDYPE